MRLSLRRLPGLSLSLPAAGGPPPDRSMPARCPRFPLFPCARPTHAIFRGAISTRVARASAAAPRFALAPALALAFALALVASAPVRADAPTGEAGADPAGGDSALRIVFVGDIMLDNGPGHRVSHGHDPFERCAHLLADADLAVGNLECVLGDEGERQLKPYVFRGAERSCEFLAKHFGALSLANNHTLDFGPAGVVETMRRLEAAGIPSFGAGATPAAARKPLVIEREGRRVALLGFNEFYKEDYAVSEARAGNNPLVADDLLADIALARGELACDIVIPFLHWGEEGEPAPREDQRDLARKCVDAGASAVIGCHPHVTQTVETHAGAPIVYSLGNFVFDYWQGDPEVNVGWVAILEFPAAAAGPASLEIVPVSMDPAGIPAPVVVPAE